MGNEEDLQLFVDTAIRLRKQADASEQEFLEFLRKGERNEQMWRPTFVTFSKLLKQLNICEPARYSMWKEASRVIPAQVIERIGVSGAVTAASISDDGKRSTALAEMVASVEKRRVPISPQNARAIVARYDPKPSTLLKNVSRVDELEAEVRTKDATIRRLEKENEELRGRVKSLEAASGGVALDNKPRKRLAKRGADNGNSGPLADHAQSA